MKFISPNSLHRSKNRQPLPRRRAGGSDESAKSSTPGLSGFTSFAPDTLLAVQDTKLEDDSSRLLLLDKNDGSVDPVEVDWSKTGRSRDLEAIAPGPNKGEFLAVEGSSWKHHKARLFELSVDENGATAKASHVLPEFGQEIEGMVTVPNQEGGQSILLAGRGGEGKQARIYWGELGKDGLEFSDEGLQGKAVKAPLVGKGQRGVADLAVDGKGGLWATATIDNGDDAPFSSNVYQLGELTPSAKQPFKTNLGKSFPIEGVKAEALSVTPQGTIFIGTDDESRGGQFGYLQGVV